MKLTERIFFKQKKHVFSLIALLACLFTFFLGFSALYAAPQDQGAAADTEMQGTGKPAIQAGTVPGGERKPSDEYGNVTEEEVEGAEGPRIADPIEPWNRAMYHVNDKLYFWLFKPAATGYKHVVNEEFRGIFKSFYENLKAPIRIVNNFLQGKVDYAGIELARFFVNSTIGAGGLKDCAKECFNINGRDADFGQTLGKYGIGFGFYIVWPVLGPSSPRDSIGWVGDRFLMPQGYISSDLFTPEKAALFAHDKVNYVSFHLGDYETLLGAAIDPYIAMRDVYVQYRKKLIEK